MQVNEDSGRPAVTFPFDESGKFRTLQAIR
jgi:hypothetical protein